MLLFTINYNAMGAGCMPRRTQTLRNTRGSECHTYEYITYENEDVLVRRREEQEPVQQNDIFCDTILFFNK